MIKIKNAVKNQAVPISRLSYTALDAYARFITMSEQSEIVEKRLQIIFNNYIPTVFHRSCFNVALNNNTVVGEVSSCKGSIIPTYNKNLCKIIETFDEDEEKISKTQLDTINTREADSDEYYIDTIAVRHNFRGKGIAELLLESVYEKARYLNFSKIVLVVDTKKPKLQSYYEKLGFSFYKEQRLGGDTYNKMLKYV